MLDRPVARRSNRFSASGAFAGRVCACCADADRTLLAGPAKTVGLAGINRKRVGSMRGHGRCSGTPALDATRPRLCELGFGSDLCGAGTAVADGSRVSYPRVERDLPVLSGSSRDYADPARCRACGLLSKRRARSRDASLRTFHPTSLHPRCCRGSRTFQGDPRPRLRGGGDRCRLLRPSRTS